MGTSVDKWKKQITEKFVDENAVTVNIRRLRMKIEENPSSPKHIISIRGVGYKWQ